ncbi:response regulator transcription factor [Polymorphospora sp. NPDC050346]|uniref:response regulator transcription factor n=1 Tax=Polymorphospora sp. NPDC050346 TaxID=3155780 RepID=UPI0033DB26EE
MIRVLVCDDHTVFAESLAELLTAARMRITAVTGHPDRALAVLRREAVDICLLDVTFGRESVLPRLAEFRRVAPGARIVLLTGRVDADLLAAAREAQVRGVADKRQPAREITALLHRVYNGDTVFPAEPTPVPVPRAANHDRAQEARRMAAFLTPRERQTLRALVGGHDTRKLARTLGVAPATARCHIQQVLTKMGAHSRLEAATTAVRFGLVSPETGDWLLPRC